MKIWPFKSKPKAFFSKAEEKIIISAIKIAEKKTSGEIRLHVESTCHKNPYERAIEIFGELKMYKTKDQNGILFYLAMESNLLSIIGDKGINEKVDGDFWDILKNKTIADFKSKRFAEGLEKSIMKCGEVLQKHFPYQSDDKNELDDTISYGK
jgi:uncharacterized membrane protein